jgi:hypothetical protein
MGHEMTGPAQSGRFGLTGEGDGGDGDVRHLLGAECRVGGCIVDEDWAG